VFDGPCNAWAILLSRITQIEITDYTDEEMISRISSLLNETLQSNRNLFAANSLQ
jgi:hypothetical protein